METLTTPATAAFPRNDIESVLRAEFLSAIKAEAAIAGAPLPSDPAEAVKAVVPIDSLVAVGILCEVERIVGFELPESAVCVGGYTSVQHALDHLLPAIERRWRKKRGAK